jgi:phage shock protein C
MRQPYAMTREGNMQCTNCHKEIADHSSFCNHCGAMQIVNQTGSRACKRLLRSSVDRKIAGVCGGIAEYLDIDSTVVRLVWLVLIFLPVPILPAIIAYVVAWIVMPESSVLRGAVSPNIPHPTQAA